MPYKDPEKKKENARRYRQQHRQQMRLYSKRYYNNNRQRFKEYAKTWYDRNKPEVIARVKRYYYDNRNQIVKRICKYQKTVGRDAHNNRVRGYRRRDRMIVLSHYSNRKLECACCRERTYEFLTIDHINGGGHLHKKEQAHGHLYRWLMANNFPKGYRVLCINCNMAIGMYGYCPHNKKKS